MKRREFVKTMGAGAVGASMLSSGCATEDHVCPVPLFRDPVYDGPCDPQIIWNHNAREWWIFYTGRRSTLEGGATWYACSIGVAASKDGREWRHLGYCKFDGVGGTADMPDTYWAPGIVRDGDTYHMFVTLLPGHPEPFTGIANIVHCTAEGDLLNNWKTVGPMPLEERIIDATILKIGNEWRMWHKLRSQTNLLVSPDLYQWEDRGLVKGDVNSEPNHEAPYAFEWKGYYWLITDPHQGMPIYRSKDTEVWTEAGWLLVEPGTRPFDDSRGRHCSVAVSGGRAFMFYHVEPNRRYDLRLPATERPVENKWSVLQAVELEYNDGNVSCDRNKVFDLYLPPGE